MASRAARRNSGRPRNEGGGRRVSGDHFDLLVAGGGPAGAAAALVAARAGLRTLVIERERFPREKVCGDCLHRDGWAVLERLGVAAAARALPAGEAREFAFVPRRGRAVVLRLRGNTPGERVIRRAHFDEMLLRAAAAAGAELWEGEALCSLRRAEGGPSFEAVTTSGRRASSTFCVAADGRNSTAARLLGVVPTGVSSERIGLQAHVPRPADWPAERLELRWFSEGGYGGFAPAADGMLNVAAAVPAAQAKTLRAALAAEFQLDPAHDWRVVAPLETPGRPAARADGLFLAGDAARVVEPFTGEGIYYALRTGELAAAHAVRAFRGEVSGATAAADYSCEHAALYRGRIWVNRLARWAGTHPVLAGTALRLARRWPGILRFLTAKVVGDVKAIA